MAEYNGWTNWDTWNTSLWLDNDPYSYDIVTRRAGWCETAEELADWLSDNAKMVLEEMGCEDDIDYSVVDWQEIAEHYSEWFLNAGDEDESEDVLVGGEQ